MITSGAQYKAEAAPRWVLATFGVGTAVSLYVAGGVGAWLALHSDPVRTPDQIAILELAFLGATAFFLIQAITLAGLVTRSHWGRTMALVASALWAITIVGLPVSVLVTYRLFHHFRAGLDKAHRPESPEPPRAATWLTTFGGLLAYPWAAFLLWLPERLHEVAPQYSAADWSPAVASLAYMSLPFFVVMTVAAIGLRHKHDWGIVMAWIACVLFALTGIGALAGIPVLISLWAMSDGRTPRAATLRVAA